jgi:hypothetical protein
MPVFSIDELLSQIRQNSRALKTWVNSLNFLNGELFFPNLYIEFLRSISHLMAKRKQISLTRKRTRSRVNYRRIDS